MTTAAGGTPPPPPPPPGGARKVGYFAQWGIYGRNFTLHTLDAQAMAGKLSTINYAFENVGSDGRCFEANLAGQGDAFADYQKTFDAASSVSGVADTFDQPLKGNFNQLRELKAKYPNLTVQLSIGGWTYSKFFSDAALTAASRQALVSSCIDMFIKGNLPFVQGDPAGGPGSAAGVFDGIDIDWEWPGSEGNAGNVIRPQDKQNFTLLMAEFRRQLDAYGASVGKHYSLSAFLPADPAKIAAGFEVPQVFSSLDWATVQGYDFHGAWETRTMHQANLLPGRQRPVAGEVQRRPGDQLVHLGRGAGRRSCCSACPTTAAAGPESARPTTGCSSPAPPPRAPGRPASRTTRCSRTGRAPGSGTPPPARSGCTTARTGGRTTTRRSSRRRPRTSSRRASAG